MCLPSCRERLKLTAKAIRLLVAFFFALGFASTLEAKTTTVSGTVFTIGADRVQSIWPNARVTLKNLKTSNETATISNELGTIHLPVCCKAITKSPFLSRDSRRSPNISLSMEELRQSLTSNWFRKVKRRR